MIHIFTSGKVATSAGDAIAALGMTTGTSVVATGSTTAVSTGWGVEDGSTAGTGGVSLGSCC